MGRLTMATVKGYRPALRQRTTERNVQDAIIARLAWHGWEVVEVSQPQRVLRGLVGVPAAASANRPR